MREIPSYFSATGKVRASVALANDPGAHLVPLTPDEVVLALARGRNRRVQAINNGCRESRGLVVNHESHGLQLNIQGAIGELAFSKWLGIYPANPPDDRSPDFLGCVEVKTRCPHKRDLLVPIPSKVIAKLGGKEFLLPEWYVMLSMQWMTNEEGVLVPDPFALVHGAFHAETNLDGVAEIGDPGNRGAPVWYVKKSMLVPADEARGMLRMIAYETLGAMPSRIQAFIEHGVEMPQWAKAI